MWLEVEPTRDTTLREFGGTFHLLEVGSSPGADARAPVEFDGYLTWTRPVRPGPRVALEVEEVKRVLPLLRHYVNLWVGSVLSWASMQTWQR